MSRNNNDGNGNGPVLQPSADRHARAQETQQLTSRLMQLPEDIFAKILEAACHDHQRSSCHVHALYCTCRQACHATRRLIKRLCIDLDDHSVQEGIRQVNNFRHLSILKIATKQAALITDFMAGSKAAAASLAQVRNLDVESHGQNVDNDDLFNIIVAMPSLRSLTLEYPAARLNVQPLQSLTGLRELELLTFEGTMAVTRELPSTISLKCLVGLTRLNIDVNNVSHLVSQLAQLPNLSCLDITSNHDGDAHLAVPGFSRLRQLTHLSWVEVYHYQIMQRWTLDAICSCTLLQSIELGGHTITTDEDIQLLAAMPNLRHLTIGECLTGLQVSPVDKCAWEKLRIVDSNGTNDVLPFHCVPVLSIVRAEWQLGPGSDAVSVGAAAADINAAAKLLVNSEPFDMRLTWPDLPACPTGPIIAALAPIGHLIKHLRLEGSCIMDMSTIHQMSEVLPALPALTLFCKVNSSCLAGLHSLACLTELRIGLSVEHLAALVEFAVAVERELHILVFVDNPMPWLECQDAIDTQRQLHNKPKVTLTVKRQGA